MASINLQQLAGCLAARARTCSLDRAEPGVIIGSCWTYDLFWRLLYINPRTFFGISVSADDP
jgi:hypothetical protein